MPATRKAAPRPSAYAARRTAPFSTVPLSLARTSTAASTVPMQGAAQTANAPPRSAPEPRRRAPVSKPGASKRSGTGSSPRNARPSTMRTKPAISVCALGENALPTAAAPAPSTTKTTVNPKMNGTGAAQHCEDAREPEDERQARGDDATRRAALAQLPVLDARERRQVAGHERQHARRDDRREAGEECDRQPCFHQSRRARSSSS